MIPHNSKPLKTLRVLVVDDDPDEREFYRFAFELHGASVTAVSSVGAALEAFRASKPDVLVSEIALPGTSGFDLLRNVRALETDGTPRVPALGLTAWDVEADRARADDAGFQACLEKPVALAALVSAVARLARGGRPPAATSRRVAPSPLR